MRDRSVAVSVSLVFHIVIVALFLRVPFDQYIRPKLMVLDFSIERERQVSDGEAGNRKSHMEDRKTQQGPQPAENQSIVKKVEENIKPSPFVEPSAMQQRGLSAVASDPSGRVTVQGETSQIGARADVASDNKAPANAYGHNTPLLSGGVRAIDYGKNGLGLQDFPFITDTINKRFKDRYPERALSMGWEGEVLLSFTISENGTVRDAEIVKGAGRRIFDDYAREIIMKTTFDKKLPYSLRIENWRITYQLPK
jgi:TonB family protein